MKKKKSPDNISINVIMINGVEHYLTDEQTKKVLDVINKFDSQKIRITYYDGEKWNDINSLILKFS